MNMLHITPEQVARTDGTAPVSELWQNKHAVTLHAHNMHKTAWEPSQQNAEVKNTRDTLGELREVFQAVWNRPGEVVAAQL